MLSHAEFQQLNQFSVLKHVMFIHADPSDQSCCSQTPLWSARSVLWKLIRDSILSEKSRHVWDSHLSKNYRSSKTRSLRWDSHICLKATAHQTRSPVAPGLGPKITCPRLAHYSGFPCKVKSCTNLSKHSLTHLIPHLTLKCVSHSYWYNTNMQKTWFYKHERM